MEYLGQREGHEDLPLRRQVGSRGARLLAERRRVARGQHELPAKALGEEADHLDGEHAVALPSLASAEKEQRLLLPVGRTGGAPGPPAHGCTPAGQRVAGATAEALDRRADTPVLADPHGQRWGPKSRVSST